MDGLTGNWDNLQIMLEEQNHQSKLVHMEINMSTTKILTNLGLNQPIKIGNQEIEIINNVIYLGQTISFQNQNKKEIDKRLAIGWSKFGA